MLRLFSKRIHLAENRRLLWNVILCIHQDIAATEKACNTFQLNYVRLLNGGNWIKRNHSSDFPTNRNTCSRRTEKAGLLSVANKVLTELRSMPGIFGLVLKWTSSLTGEENKTSEAEQVDGVSLGDGAGALWHSCATLDALQVRREVYREQRARLISTLGGVNS